MQKLKCIIVDDEEAAIKIIRSHLKDNPRIEIIGEYQNPIQAFQHLNEADLVFLDITFQDYATNGVSFISQMGGHSAKVIIISGSKEHAHDILEFYGNVVLGYLLKPVDALELINLIDKVYQITFKEKKITETTITQPSPNRKFFHIKTSEKKEKGTIERIFKFDQVLYFKGNGDYREVHTRDDTFLTLESLKDIVARLPKDIFVETHRSYVVNLTNIERIEGNEIFFHNSDRQKKRATTTPENKVVLLNKIGE